MKRYNRLVIWVDYFNSVLSRSDGRRVPLAQAVRNPSLDELAEAVRRLKYAPDLHQAAHPKRSFSESGYVSIERRKRKEEALNEIAPILTVVRGEKRHKH